MVFYQGQLPRHSEALRYLEQRGVHDPALIQELRIGYAPGDNLRQHLMAQGYSLKLLQHIGLVNSRGHDAFYRRVVFPCCQDGRVLNLCTVAISAPLSPIVSSRAPGAGCSPGNRFVSSSP